MNEQNIDSDKSIYDYELDLSDANSSHTKILNLLERNWDVLEIGCATGYLTRYMKEELGCRVYCIEIDKEAAEKAEAYCEGMYNDDVETLNFEEVFDAIRFDAIVLADIIEHLKNP